MSASVCPKKDSFSGPISAIFTPTKPRAFVEAAPINSNASIRFDYGWQLEDIGLPDSSRAHLGGTVTY